MTPVTTNCAISQAGNVADSAQLASAEIGGKSPAPDRPTPPRAMIGTVGLVARVRAVVQSLHRIIGAPDYDGYVAHVNSAHPGREPMSRDDFTRERLENRYSRPGARCC